MPAKKVPEQAPTDDEAPAPRAAGGPVAPGVPHLIGDDAPEIIIPDPSRIVLVDAHGVTEGACVIRACASFHDLETKRDYRAGDLVPWDMERAAKYAARGLVEIVS
jgi:hypothetical protein